MLPNEHQVLSDFLKHAKAVMLHCC